MKSTFREVENALGNERLFAERERYLQSVVNSNEGEVNIAKAQLLECTRNHATKKEFATHTRSLQIAKNRGSTDKL